MNSQFGQHINARKAIIALFIGTVTVIADIYVVHPNPSASEQILQCQSCYRKSIGLAQYPRPFSSPSLLWPPLGSHRQKACRGCGRFSTSATDCTHRLHQRLHHFFTIALWRFYLWQASLLLPTAYTAKEFQLLFRKVHGHL